MSREEFNCSSSSSNSSSYNNNNNNNQRFAESCFNGVPVGGVVGGLPPTRRHLRRRRRGSIIVLTALVATSAILLVTLVAPAPARAAHQDTRSDSAAPVRLQGGGQRAEHAGPRPTRSSEKIDPIDAPTDTEDVAEDDDEQPATDEPAPSPRAPAGSQSTSPAPAPLPAFSWRQHQASHGLYAHRSLMSTAGVWRPPTAAEAAATGELDEEDLEPLRTRDFVEKEWMLMFRALDLAYHGSSSSILFEVARQTNIFDTVVSQLEPQCKRDIYHIRESVNKHKLWALRMVDSFGKIPSGVTYGKFSSPGDYEECLSVRVDELIHRASSPKMAPNRAERFKFHGKYCLLDFRLPMPERPLNRLISVHEPVLDLSNTDLAKKFPELLNYTGYASVLYDVGYMHAFCLPSSCDVMDLARSMGRALEGLHLIVNNTVDCQENPPPEWGSVLGISSWRPSQVLAVWLIGLLFANAALASLVLEINRRRKRRLDKRATQQHDIMEKPPKSSALDSQMGHLVTPPNAAAAAAATGDPKKQSALFVSVDELLRKPLMSFYADCFSIQSNFERLTKPDPRGLTFVHYTRIVAMALTVITHTAGLGTLQAITKPADASNTEQMFRDFIPQMLANAFTSIQVFFFMAGFMLVVSTYPSLVRERGQISFVEYAVKRAIRLMPGIAATIAVNFVWPLFVDGPMLSYFVRLIVVPCETNWWHTLGFISNFDHVEKMCLRHSYFSASDYQLHIMAFPLLILLYKQPIVALFMAGILTAAGFVAQVIMIVTKTVLPFIMVDYIDKEAFFNVVHYIHHPVWNHMSAFFYGFILGYVIVKQIRIQLGPKTIKRIWLVMTPLGVASIFAPYFWNHYKRPIYLWQRVLYVLFDRFILLTFCAWLSYATMVLGRPPKRKPKATDSQQQQQPPQDKPLPPTNDSKNVSRHDPLVWEVPKSPASSTRVPVSTINIVPPSPSSSGKSSKNDLKQGVLGKLQTPTTASLPRQHSSPNFASLNRKPTGELKLSISTMNVNACGAEEDLTAEKGHEKTVPPANCEPVEQPQVTTARASAPPRKATVSNVNTLCLVLSRLTFQLYLFNMVVLWIDVNHSKYNWYFSYYFIITKAFAIYIGSSLFAAVFFITLESPCLTLYIAWVKSRAEARARWAVERARLKGEAATMRAAAMEKKAATGAANSSHGAHKTSHPRYLRASPKSARPTDDHQEVPTSKNTDTSSTKHTSSNSSDDGLCMRPGTRPANEGGITNPAFTFIDLNTPCSSGSDTGENQSTDQTNQTRM